MAASEQASQGWSSSSAGSRNSLPRRPSASDARVHRTALLEAHHASRSRGAPYTKPQPLRYAAATTMATSSAATAYDSIILNTLQAQQPRPDIVAHQNIESPHQSAASGELRNLLLIERPAPTHSPAEQPNRLSCTLCGYVCASEEGLSAHGEFHGLFNCDICGKPCTLKNREAHRRTHEPPVPRKPKTFRCPHCPKTYSREGSFKSHLLKHENLLTAGSGATKHSAAGTRASTPARAVIDLTAGPSSSVSVARPVDNSFSSPAVLAHRPAASEESALFLDDLDYSDSLYFASAEKQQCFQQRWNTMINDIWETHFGDC